MGEEYRQDKNLLQLTIKSDRTKDNSDTRDYRNDDESFYECFSLCWRAKIITVEPIVFLYVLERYLVVLFSGLYFYQRFARDSLQAANYSAPGEYFCINASYLDKMLGEGASDSVEDNATELTFHVALSATLVSIASTVIIGPMTDLYGRKFALISVYIGRMIGELMILVIVYYSLNLNWYIASTVISSVFGDYGVFVMAVTAYVSDISSLKKRLLRIGVLGLATYISTGVSTIVGGTWISEVDCDFKSVAWAPFISCVVGVLASMFTFPESLSKDQRKLKRLSAESCKGLKTIWSGLMLYFRRRLVTVKLWISLFVLLLLLTIARGALLIETFFFIRRPLEWSPEEIGLYGGYNAVTHGLALLLLMPIALAIGVPDVILAIVGVLSSCLGYLFTAGVRKTWHMFAISTFQGIEAVIVPSIHSMMSKYVGKEEQGALFAFVSSVEALATILGSAIFINLYSALHQQSYFIMAILAFTGTVPLFIVWIIERCSRRQHQQRLTSNDNEEKLQ